MLNRNEGWAFGQDGVRLRYTIAPDHPEPTWQAVEPLDRAYGALQTLSMVNEREGWAVRGGRIFHLQNDEWEKVWEGSHINDLFMLDATEGWAVGEEGVILHYQQGVWEMVASPTQNWLNSVVMLNAEEGWAVGLKGTVLHYTNQTWEPVSVSEADFYARDFMDIAILDHNEIWVVGDAILHYQAGTWLDIFPERLESRLNDVDFVNADEAWAVGVRGTIFHYDQDQWQAVDNPLRKDLLSVDMIDENEGWAVGVDSTILHYIDEHWHIEEDADPQFLKDVDWLPDNNTGWAVGTAPTDTGLVDSIVQYRDNKWQVVAYPLDGSKQRVGLNAIDMLTPDEGWVVGEEGAILHYIQGEWQISPRVTSSPIRDVALINEQEGWAVGADGLILHYSDESWKEFPSPVSSSILALDMLSAEEGWAVGRNTILHYQNGVWQESPIPFEGFVELWGLDMVDEQFGWAVGRSGLILKYQHGSWRQVDRLASTDQLYIDQLLTVSAPQIDEAWASGSEGILLHYQNEQWQVIERPGSLSSIQSIIMLNETEGWAVGDGILHYTNE